MSACHTPGLKRRLASLFYELLLLTAIEFFLFLLPQAAWGVLYGKVLPGPWLMVHAVLAAALYFIGFWHKQGQTLPMRTWHFRLENAHGGRAPLHRLVLRFLWAGFINVPIGLGFFWAFFDQDGQFLHDRLAGTRLILHETPRGDRGTAPAQT